jgi:ATP-dependent helicase Lhr and Lhr-like helicase
MTIRKSNSFNLLDEKVQKWIWRQGWQSLHDIQEAAVEPILNRKTDVIISSATASGKTEAAFLPIISYLTTNDIRGYQVLCVSPLKALINDQFRRIEDICKDADVKVTPWHGDISGARKNQSFKQPTGILLITPESLESLFVNRGAALTSAFGELKYIVIDEFHSFIGTERGCQLLSLIHRLNTILKKDIPRIALSATLGDLDLAARYLRMESVYPYKIIESITQKTDLKLQLKGYRVSSPDLSNEQPTASEDIANNLFQVLRGSSNLIFANSRQNTEFYSDILTQQCVKKGVPNEFFPHHGNLSKEIRLEVEQRLQKGQPPTNAVCTMTLELGIDIGTVKSIAQIGSPHSVSSMRQRLGRSGRRGEPSILRIHISEKEIDKNSNIMDKLRPELIQSIALINLLLKKWYEPPEINQLHLSTLIQQILSVICQYGGFRADQAWDLLCRNGFFKNTDSKIFAALLKKLGEKNVIGQDHDGTIVIGELGDRIVNHYSFYTAFNTPDEYRLEVGGKTLGTLPINSPLSEGSYIIFAGKRWEVISVNEEKKTIQLKHAIGGRVPKFSGQGMLIHDEIRKEMKNVLMSDDHPRYLDKTAKKLLDEARYYFSHFRLDQDIVIEQGSDLFIFPWLGDRILSTIVLELREYGLKANHCGFFVEINDCSKQAFTSIVNERVKVEELDSVTLASKVGNKEFNKYDYLLGEELLCLDFASRCFCSSGSWQFFQDFHQSIIS